MKVSINLRIKAPNSRTHNVLLEKNEVIIGRDASCDVRIVDPEVSRRHAALRIESPDKIIIKDLGSSNGTYIKNSPITGEKRISPETTIRMGNSFITIEIKGEIKSQGFDMVVTPSAYLPMSEILEKDLDFFSSKTKDLLSLFDDLLSFSFSKIRSSLILSKIMGILGADNGIVVLKRSESDTEKAILAQKGEIVHYPSSILEAVGERADCIVLPEVDSKEYVTDLGKKGIGSLICAAGVNSGLIRVVIYLDRSVGKKIFSKNDLGILCHLARIYAATVTYNVDQKIQERKLSGYEAERLHFFGELATETDISTSSSNKKVQQLMFIAMRVGQSDRHVFIHGEHGSGRLTLAKRIHVFSNRKEGPFIFMDALSTPRDRIREVLFGGEEKDTSPGLLERAQEGTLYIQEISAVPLDIQKELAGVLSNEYSSESDNQRRLYTSVRLIVSSSVHPDKTIADSTFNSNLLDLTYPTVLFVPSLKERNEDILSLAKHFLREYLPSNCAMPDFNPQAVELLVRYPWPGNITELRDTMSYTAAVCRERELQIGDLPYKLREHPSVTASKNLGLRQQLDTLETNLILGALERNRKIVTKAAKSLGLSESTLRYRMQRLKIEV